MDITVRKQKLFNAHPTNNFNHLLGYSYNPDGDKMADIKHGREWRREHYRKFKEEIEREIEEARRIPAGCEEYIFQSKMNFKDTNDVYRFLKLLKPGTLFPIKNIPEKVWIELSTMIDKRRDLIIVTDQEQNYLKRNEPI
jgi:hypothetical protein